MPRHDCLSNCRALVRQIDCVTVKGSNKPVGLYTYDVDVEGLDGLKMSQQKPVGRRSSTRAIFTSGRAFNRTVAAVVTHTGQPCFWAVRCDCALQDSAAD